MMQPVLTAEDRSLVATRNEENWRNRASWERNAMKEDGLLRSDIPRSWALTDAGWTQYRRLETLGPARSARVEPDPLALFSEPVGEGYVTVPTTIGILSVWRDGASFAGSTAASADGLT